MLQKKQKKNTTKNKQTAAKPSVVMFQLYSPQQFVTKEEEFEFEFALPRYLNPSWGMMTRCVY